MKKLYLFCAAFLISVSCASAQTASDSCMKVTALMQRGDNDRNKEGQVTLLQLFLVQHFKLDATKYLTGVYDKRTEDLVKRLQKQSGYPAVGNFGPRTREYARGLCLSYNPSLSGASPQTQPKTQTAEQTKNILTKSVLGALETSGAKDDIQTLIGGGTFAGLVLNYYTHFQTVPIYTVPTPLAEVIPPFLRRLAEVEQKKVSPQEIDKAIVTFQKMIGGLTYVSDVQGKNFCVGFSLKTVTLDDLMQRYQLKKEDFACSLAQALPPQTMLVGVSEQKLQEYKSKLEDAKKKTEALRAVQNVKMVQLALELSYDSSTRFPIRTTATPVSALSELAPFLRNYQTMDMQYVSNDTGKTYCLGTVVTGELPQGSRSVCANGLQLPAAVNYVVEP